MNTRTLIILFLSFVFFLCNGQEKKKSCFGSGDSLFGQKIYTLTDSLPTFGDFHKYLQKNFKASFTKDPDNPIYSIVYTFVIDTAGQLHQPCITNNLNHPNYDKLQSDFVKALEKCPKWRCGYNDKNKVVVRLTYVMDIKLGW